MNIRIINSIDKPPSKIMDITQQLVTAYKHLADCIQELKKRVNEIDNIIIQLLDENNPEAGQMRLKKLNDLVKFDKLVESASDEFATTAQTEPVVRLNGIFAEYRSESERVGKNPKIRYNVIGGDEVEDLLSDLFDNGKGIIYARYNGQELRTEAIIDLETYLYANSEIQEKVRKLIGYASEVLGDRFYC